MNYRDEITGNVETIKSGEVVEISKLLESIEKTLEIIDFQQSEIHIIDEGKAKNTYQFLVGIGAKVSILKELIQDTDLTITKN